MKRSRFLRNVASNWAHVVWGVGWGIVLTPFYIKTLGRADYGIWLLVHSVVGYYGLLDLGVRSAVVRFVSRSLALKDHRETNETLNTALALYASLGLLALLLSVVMALVLPGVEGFAASRHPDAGWLILLVGATMALSFPGRLLEGVLSAAERFDLSNLLVMGFSAVRNVSFVVALLSGGGLLAMAWILLAVTALEKVVVTLVVLRKVPGVRLSLRMARRDKVRGIFSYGIHTFLAQAGERLRLYTDSIVIGAFLPAQAITVFNIGNRPLQYLSRVSRGVSRVLTPAFSRTEAVRGREQLRRLLILGTRATTFVVAPACLLLAISGDRLLRLWVGPGFEESTRVLLVLIPAYLFASSQNATGSYLYGTSRHQILSRLTLLEGFINLGLSIWWIRSLGLVGVALGTAVPLLVLRCIVVPIYACRTVDLSFGQYLRQAMGPVLWPFGAALGVGLWLMRAIPGGDLLSVAALDATVGLVYAVAALGSMWLRGDELLPGGWRRSTAGEKVGKPRILLLAYRFPPQGGGGVQRPLKWAKYWSREGARVAVLAGPARASPLTDPTLLAELPEEVRVVRAPDLGPLPLLRRILEGRRWPRVADRMLVALVWLAQRLSVPDGAAGWILPAVLRGFLLAGRFRPTHLVATGPPWSTFVAGRALAGLLRLPLVLDYRDPWSATYLPIPRRGLGPRLAPATERWVLRGAAGVLAAHGAILERLRPWLPPGLLRMWVPNGYDTEDFREAGTPLDSGPGDASAPQAGHRAEADPGGLFTLTYTGGFFTWRTPETLLRVLDALVEEGRVDPRRFRLRVAGSARRLGALLDGRLVGMVRMEGYVPHHVSVRLLRESTANLVMEGDLGERNLHTPGKFYEVVYARRPVLLLCPEGVTTRLARRVGGCLVAHPKDAEAIRGALLRLYEAWSRGESLPRPEPERIRFYDRAHQARRAMKFLERVARSAH
jgi:O-antigen/teichoic acid export membrane protein/glycosyltransferase involved in cell wall biosynthesis